MSIRNRLSGVLAAVGAMALSEKVAGNVSAVTAATPKDEPEVAFMANDPGPQKPVKKASAAKESFMDRFIRERPARLAYYRSYKGGKHRRGVSTHTQFEYVQAAQLKRARKNAKRVEETAIAISNYHLLSQIGSEKVSKIHPSYAG